jgi:uncharacterized phage protein (TIGR01671 family)
MQDRFLFRIWDKESQKYHNGMEVFDYMRGLLNEDKYVMEQATGLKDKNGKLIYEGDILKCVHSEIMKYKVYWARCGYRMKVYGTDNKLVDVSVIFLDTSTLEVIGNIHENADLLGEE